MDSGNTMYASKATGRDVASRLLIILVLMLGVKSLQKVKPEIAHFTLFVEDFTLSESCGRFHLVCGRFHLVMFYLVCGRKYLV